MQLFRTRPAKPKYPRLLNNKLELIDYAFTRFNLKSFADLGGVWGVEGGYTFTTLEKHDVSKAFLVDTHPTETVLESAKRFPQLKLVRGNFGAESSAREVGNVDAIFLFDVLLHQVDPDWDRIIDMYAGQIKAFIIYNQQWTGPGNNVRLLDLGEQAYFDNVPHVPTEEPYIGLYQRLEEKHPDHNKKWKDVHHIWQWGITDLDLITKMSSIGFKMQYMKNCGVAFGLKNFEDHMFIFTR
jgi:hypothetical protein